MSKNNGSVVTMGPQIQRREAWVDLPEEYAGFKVKIWVNAPNTLWDDTKSTDETKVAAAVKRIFLEHNGWRDYEGNTYPSPTEDDFWQQIPTELATVMIVVAQKEAATLPNSMLPKRQR